MRLSQVCVCECVTERERNERDKETVEDKKMIAKRKSDCDRIKESRENKKKCGEDEMTTVWARSKRNLYKEGAMNERRNINQLGPNET